MTYYFTPKGCQIEKLGGGGAMCDGDVHFWKKFLILAYGTFKFNVNRISDCIFALRVLRHSNAGGGGGANYA